MPQDTLKNTTRGGQVLLHNLRMINQVVGKVTVWLLPVAFLFAVTWFVFSTDAETRYLGQAWLHAKIGLWVQGKHRQQLLYFANGTVAKVYASQIVSAPFVLSAIEKLKHVLCQSLWVGGISYLLAVSMTLSWLRRHGDTYTQNKSLQGDQLQEATLLRQSILQSGHGTYLILGKEQLPLPKNSELQHFLVHGTTGCGKSTIIKSLLDQIRSRGERAIIYDKSCNLVSQFYQSKKDVLLNPLDARSVSWSLWSECQEKADFDNISAALIAGNVNAHDPFWINAARTIFAAAAFKLYREGNKSIRSLLQVLLNSDLEVLQTLLQGTEAASLISEKAEKTALSIKSVLATYLKSLSYLEENEEAEKAFSIQKWIADDSNHSWLFISSLGDKHETLRPLISVWLDIAINALLSLPEQKGRRIWVVLDELGSLQQLPYLTSGLSEARKFGGCFVVGIQSYAQLGKIYGHEGSREISSMLNTRFLFRIPDPEIALWSAKNLGETTLEEVREGISYGANTTRDGVSIHRQERSKPVVPASEIMRLPDLECFVRLAGAYPITRLHMLYKNRPQLGPGFIPRVFQAPEMKFQSALDNQNLDIQKHFSQKEASLNFENIFDE